MIIVPKRQIWTRQPTAPVDIDWSNQLAQGLAFASPLRPGVGMLDLVQKQTPTWVGDSERGSNRYGEFAKTGSSYLSFAKQPQITHTQPCSITWIQEPSSVSGYHTALEFNVGGGGAFVVGFQSNAAAAYYMVCGIRNGTTEVSYWDIFGPPVVGQTNIYTAVFPDGLGGSPTNCKLYRDGVGYSRTGVSALSANNGGHFYIGARDGAYDRFYGLLGNVLIHGRALDEGEAKGLHENPWQIYKRRSRHVFAGASGSPTAYTLPADSGTFALTGTDATLARGRALPADSGTFALTGTDAVLAAGRVLVADSGTFALTGTAATLTRGRVVAADSGTFVLTGTDATLEYTPVSGDTYTLPCASGSFALTGTDAVLAAGRVLVADSASFALTGTAAVLAVGHVLTADAGSIALTGTDATLLTGRVLPADAGVFALTGTDVTLTYAAPPLGEVTLSAQTISDIADAVYARFLLGAVPVNIVQVNSTPVDGTGTQADPWGPV